jgi:hypothetical protein
VSDIKKGGLHVDWTTVSYRSVFLAVLAVFLAGSIASYFVFPDQTHPFVDKIVAIVKNWFPAKDNGVETPIGPSTQAHFTNLDGTVRVKKAASPTWVKADYGLPLEQGDVVQTMSEGIAKVAFADGSTYVIQPDSLVTIEESTMNSAQQNKVSMRVVNGDITLNTSDAPSTQEVKIDESSTTAARDSAVQAHNRGSAPEVMVTKGSADFKMGTTAEKIAPFQKVQFDPEKQTVTKKQEIKPPVLMTPANRMPVFVAANARTTELSWTPVDDISTYHVRVSRNPYFSSVEKDAHINGTSYKIGPLEDGKYYWVVQSEDDDGHQSIESDKDEFTIVTKGAEGLSLALELKPFIQHAHVIEIKGNTEPGARVMVNGEQVPGMALDGSFTYFTPQLPTGENLITITAQNEKGAVNTTQRTVVIQ